VSGECGTWFLKLKPDMHYQYKLQFVSATHLTVRTIPLFNVMNHYFGSSYRYATPKINARCSLICVIIKRMIVGAGVGYKKYLRVRGMGYKFELKPKNLLAARVGYASPIEKKLPYDFSIRFSRKSKVIRLRSNNLLKINNFITNLRRLRKPDIYNGKGIRYKRDPIRRKPGKRKTRSASKKRRKFQKRRFIPRRKKRLRRRKRKNRKKKRLQLFLNKNVLKKFVKLK